MAKYESMDILQAPTREDGIVASFKDWIVAYHADEDNITTFTFKKKTPRKILKSYEKHYDLFEKHAGFKVSPTYKVAQ